MSEGLFDFFSAMELNAPAKEKALNEKVQELQESIDKGIKTAAEALHLGYVPPVVPLAAPEPAVTEPFSLFGDTVSPPAPEAVTAPPAALPEPGESIASIIGKNVVIPELPFTLDRRQKRHTNLTSRTIHVNGTYPTAQDIYDLWPRGLLKNGVSSSIKDPAEVSRVSRAGFRPMINDLQGYLESTEYAEAMLDLGITVNTENTGLTAEQMGLLTILSNYADGKSLRAKLRDAGVSWTKFQAWQSQPVFSRYYNQIGGDALKSSMPIAKQQIAAKVAAGDMQGIKLAMEMTGEYDPKGQKAIDAQALLRIVFEVMEEEVRDPAILQRIAGKLSLRAQMQKGIS